ARTRTAMAATGTLYAAADAALAAPAVGSLGAGGGIALAARFPTATAIVTDIGNGLTGTTLPRVAVGVGSGTALARAGSSALSSVTPTEIQEAEAIIGQEVQQGAAPMGGQLDLFPGENVALPGSPFAAPGPVNAVGREIPYGIDVGEVKSVNWTIKKTL